MYVALPGKLTLTQRFNMLLTPSDARKLAALAEADEVKASHVVRVLIRREFDRRQRSRPPPPSKVDRPARSR